MLAGLIYTLKYNQREFCVSVSMRSQSKETWSPCLSYRVSGIALQRQQEEEAMLSVFHQSVFRPRVPRPSLCWHKVTAHVAGDEANTRSRIGIIKVSKPG